MRFTAEEFFQLAKSEPIAHHAGKVELVDGVIVAMNSAYSHHSKYQGQVTVRLGIALGDEMVGGWVVRPELTIRLNDYNIRDADVAVIRNVDESDHPARPHETLLIVEIAVSTLAHDLGAKLLSYANGGIPHYWVVDVEGRRTLCHSNPHEGTYGDCEAFPFGTRLPIPQTGKSIIID